MKGLVALAHEKNGKNTVAVVEELVRPIVEEMGLRLWDVRFEKEGPDWYLRILIDRDEPLDTDTCADVSHTIDPVIDEADPIDQSYFMEVGSPGLGRRLTRPEHYDLLQGQKISVRLIRPNEDGIREFEGILLGHNHDQIQVQTDQGVISFASASAGFVKLCDDEDLF